MANINKDDITDKARPDATDKIYGTDKTDGLWRDYPAKSARSIPVVSIDNTDSPYALDQDDYGKLIRVDASSGAVTVTLPAEATAGDGWHCDIYSVDTTNTITVQDDGSTEQWEMEESGQLVRPVTDGTSWFNAKPGALLKRTVHTSDATHTYRAGAVKAFIRGTGAGAGGNSGDDSAAKAGAGGAAGATVEKTIDISSASDSVTIGAGGTAGTAGNPGGAGGDTSFGSQVTAAGGPAGLSSVASGKAGATASGGDLNINGGDGTGGSATAGASGSPGGSSYYGGGGGGGSAQGGGAQGTVPGSGGGGGGEGDGTGDKSGATGADGLLDVSEYA